MKEHSRSLKMQNRQRNLESSSAETLGVERNSQLKKFFFMKYSKEDLFVQQRLLGHYSANQGNTFIKQGPS